MFIRLALFALAGSVGSGSIVLAQQAPPSEIVTSGTAVVRLPPDRAVVTIGIDSRAATAAMASSANVTPVGRVRSALVRFGLPADSARVSSYSVEPAFDYEHGGKILHYEARTVLRVRLRELARLGQLFDVVLGAGATAINQIEFESDTLEVARRNALATALGEARADATALAVAAGGHLGRLLSVTTGGSLRTPEVYRLEEIRVQASMSRGAPAVNRDVVVTAAIQARWEFVPGS